MVKSFYEAELRALFQNQSNFANPQFVGHTCTAYVAKDTQVRTEFMVDGHSKQAYGLKAVVVHNKRGLLGTAILNFSDVEALGTDQQGFSVEGASTPSWPKKSPTSEQYQLITQVLFEKVQRICDAPAVLKTSPPKLIYICAPLRGDVEKNTAFATEKAKEVFLDGDLPVCPHLMFPPIADPENEIEDEQARHLGLKLVESCQQLNVYGTEWTDGMWAEIHHAERHGIPIYTDQQEIPRGTTRTLHLNQTKARTTHER